MNVVHSLCEIVSSIDEWRVFWLPDCDNVAASSNIENKIIAKEVNYNNLHGTDILTGSKVHPIIASTIWKAYKGILNKNTHMKDILLQN